MQKNLYKSQLENVGKILEPVYDSCAPTQPPLLNLSQFESAIVSLLMLQNVQVVLIHLPSTDHETPYSFK